jgi:hypothetical protein
MAGRQERVEPLDRAYDLSSFSSEVEAVARGDRSMQQCLGESPPDAGAGDRRFFYAATLRIDNLYHGVAQGLYGNRPDTDLTDKPTVLRRLQADGFWLIDAVDQPINHLPPGPRRAAITAAVPQLVARCRALAPRRGVIICHRVVYQLATPSLRDAGSGCCMTSPCRSPSATGEPTSSPGSARHWHDTSEPRRSCQRWRLQLAPELDWGRPASNDSAPNCRHLRAM